MKKIVKLTPTSAFAGDELPYDRDAFKPDNGRTALFFEGTRLIDPLTIATSTALLPGRRVYAMFSESPNYEHGTHTYAVHAIGEVVGVSKPDYYSGAYYYCTVYVANLITLGFPNGPSFCQPLQTGLIKINVEPRRYDWAIDGTSVFFPACKLGWGNTSYGIGMAWLDSNVEDADERKIAYTLHTSAESTAVYHFLTTPAGMVSVAADSEVSDILHAEFQLVAASGTYRVLAGYDFAVALDAAHHMWWLSWKCQGGTLSPYLYRMGASGDVSKCRFLATPAALMKPKG